MTPRDLCDAREAALSAVRAARTGQARFEASEVEARCIEACADALPGVLDELDVLRMLVAEWQAATRAFTVCETEETCAASLRADDALLAYRTDKEPT